VKDHDRGLNTVSGRAAQQGLHGNLFTSGQGSSESHPFGNPGGEGLAVTHLRPRNRRLNAQQRQQRGEAKTPKEGATGHHFSTPEPELN
jgi:hypothetical protein